MEVSEERKKFYLDLTGGPSPATHMREEVFSPMTELSISFHNSCTSHCSTPRRRLSLSLMTTPPKKSVSTAESIESGIDTCTESPSTFGNSAFPALVDSPSFFVSRPRSRSRSSSTTSEISLRKRLAIQSHCSVSEALNEHPMPWDGTREKVKDLKLVFGSESEDDKDADPGILASSPESDEVAALTSSSMELNMSQSEANRSLSAPPALDCVEKYFTDLDNPSPVSCDDGFSEFVYTDDDSGQLEGVSLSVAGLINAPLIESGANKNSEDAECRNVKRKTRFQICGDESLENTSDKMSIFRPKPDVTFAKPIDVPLKKRSVSFSVKRTEPPRDVSPVIRKRLRLRSKSLLGANDSVKCPLAAVNPNISPGRFGRSLSLDSPKNKAVAQLLGENEENLVGDASQAHCLPTFIGRNEDLKTISSETLKKALDGDFNNSIGELLIVDCRYPYEYKGGHIRTAVNIFTKEDMTEEFLRKPKRCSEKRLVIVFHCEFSSQRGPSMYRFLRNKDRDIHKHCYPKLHYPELYLLEGGYKEFFSKGKEYCEPQTYLCMHDENYSQELKHFVKRSKSWTEGNAHLRTGLRY